jgi:EAL domain-containing protein (putative c-di-GMP-specific phosphodiesterase class I)
LHSLARLKRQALQILGESGMAPGDRAGLESRFSRALDSLWMAYQPIVSLSDRRIVAYEALVRTEETTLQGSGYLFDAAERLGRVHELGRHVRSFVAGSVGLAPDDVMLFVNLHPLDLTDEELFAQSSPLTPHARRVVLELTERASLEGIGDLRHRIQRLRALGYRIAVDDLGAGYAGLGALAHMEPDIAKVDMSLVRSVDQNPTKRSVIRSMAGLCSELGIRLIAEGVETTGERDALLESGCDLFQGFLFAAPVREFVRLQFG